MVLGALSSVLGPISISIARAHPGLKRNRVSTRRCEYYDLHNELVRYEEAWNWQKQLVTEKKALIQNEEACLDTVLVLQHQPVYTLGTGGSMEYTDRVQHKVVIVDRGGEITYHGPGQLVMYPIINLRNHKMDLNWYLRALEEVIIRVLSSTFEVKASRIKGLTGVWFGNEKVAAIGIKVSRWVTCHGLALNVTTDLEPFDCIVPCGLRNHRVGSIKRLLGQSCGPENSRSPFFDDADLIEVAHSALLKEFAQVFQLQIIITNTLPNFVFMDKLHST